MAKKGRQPATLVPGKNRKIVRDSQKKRLKTPPGNFKTIFDNAGDGIVVLDMSGHIIEVNETFCQMIGVVCSEIIGKIPMNFQPPGHPDVFKERIREIKEKKSLVFETILQRKDRDIFPVEIHGRMILFNDSDALLGVIRDITDRKVAEKELQENEEKFRSLINASSEGLILVDETGIIIEWNPAVERITGIERLKALGQLFWDIQSRLLPPERATPERTEAFRKTMLEGLNSGRLTFQTAKVKGTIVREGRIVHIEQSLFTIKTEKGIRAGSILHDISEEVETAQALATSEELFRMVFETSPLGMTLAGADFKFINVNQSFTRMLGYSAEELQSKTFKDISHPDNLGTDTDNIDRLTCNEIESYRTEKKYIHKNGTAIWAASIVSVVRDDAGKFKHFLAMVEDITERKEAQDALSTERNKLEVTLKSIGDGVITTDHSGHVEILNSVAEQLTGWSDDEAMGRPLEEIFRIVNQLTRKPGENPVKRVMESGKVIGLANHTLLIARDGTERIISDSGAPIKDPQGRIIGIVLVFRDITEKEKAEESARNLQKLDSLGILAGGIAHDFNNLLGGIFGYIDLARSTIEKGSQTSIYLDNALRVFDKAKGLTHQLLTFSKGGMPIRKTSTIDTLIRDSVQFALSGTNIQSNFDIEDGLWPCNHDDVQIGQVISNITINAQQAMPSGGHLQVTARNFVMDQDSPALKAGNYLKIILKDSGIGMSKDILRHIFDPFFTSKQKGQGLGLTTAFSIISKHDGLLEAESEPGQGSSFTIFLPALPNVFVKSESALAGTPMAHKGEGIILVMDDEPYIRGILQVLLEKMGYVVIAVHDGQKAFEVWEKYRKNGQKIFAMILDLTVQGGMGGEKLIKEIRKSDEHTVAIASSGYSEDPVMAEPEKFGFNGKLKKPYTRSELASLMEIIKKLQ